MIILFVRFYFIILFLKIRDQKQLLLWLFLSKKGEIIILVKNYFTVITKFFKIYFINTENFSMIDLSIIVLVIKSKRCQTPFW